MRGRYASIHRTNSGNLTTIILDKPRLVSLFNAGAIEGGILSRAAWRPGQWHLERRLTAGVREGRDGNLVAGRPQVGQMGQD